MKKYAYIFGSIEVMVGALLLCTTSIIAKVLPLLGRVAFQAAMAGSYSPSDYSVSFPLVTGIAIAFMMIGVAQIIVVFIKKTNA